MPAPEGFKSRPGSKSIRQFYRKHCTVCQFMKKNEEFRYQVMQSTYFNPNGKESLRSIVHSWGDPFAIATVYAHMKRHQDGDLMRARKRYTPQKPEIVPSVIDTPVNSILPQAEAAVEGQVVSKAEHDVALDEFIRMGRKLLNTNELKITSQTFLTAIKIKQDNEKNTKDRRLEMIKQFFGGDSGQQKT